MTVVSSPSSVAASTEMLVIDINYGKGTGEILVHFGDEPEVLARQFVAEKGLKPGAVTVIAKHVQATIEEFQRNNNVMRPQSPTLDGEHEMMLGALDQHKKLGEDLDNVQPTELPSSPVPTIRKEKTRNDAKEESLVPTNSSSSLQTDETKPPMPHNKDQGKGTAAPAPTLRRSLYKQKQPVEKYRSQSSSPQRGGLFNRRVTMINHINTTTIMSPPSKSSNRGACDDNLASSIDDRPPKVLSRSVSGAGDTVANATSRLYSSALAKKGLQKVLEESNAKKLKADMRARRFTLNPTSQSIVENVIVRGKVKFESVGHRLFEEGCASRERLDKASSQKVVTVPHTWMCVKCASYNDDRTVEGKLSPIKNSQCRHCGFDQKAWTPFQPTLVKTPHYAVDDIGLERRKYVPAIDTYDLYEYLYSDFRRHNLHIKSLQKNWDRMNKILTFKPELNEGTRNIVQSLKESSNKRRSGSSPAKSIGRRSPLAGSPPSRADRNIAAGDWFKMAPPERLTYHHLKMSRALSRTKHIALTVDIDGVDADEHPKKKPRDMVKYVSQLAYEYKERERRRQSLQALLQNVDPETGRAFFTPHVPARQASTLPNRGDTSDIVVRARRVGRDGRQIDVFQHLIEKTAIKREKGDRAVAQAREDERVALDKCKAVALPKSSEILSAAKERSLEEMFRLMLAGVEYDKEHGAEVTDQRRRAALICSLSSDINDWRSRRLDVRLVQSRFLIPEVKSVIDFVRAKKVNAPLQQQKSAAAPSGEQENNAPTNGTISAPITPDPSNTSSLVSYDEFRSLADKSLSERIAVGKSYVYAPRKRPEVTIQILQEQLRQETFRPQIDKKSAQIARKSHEVKPVHEVLINKGAQNKIKAALARKEKQDREEKEFSFTPHLYKAPSYIVPKYRMAKPLTDVAVEPAAAAAPAAITGGSPRRIVSVSSPPRDTVSSAMRRRSADTTGSSQQQPHSPHNRLSQDNGANAASLSFIANLYTGGRFDPPPLPSEVGAASDVQQ